VSARKWLVDKVEVTDKFTMVHLRVAYGVPEKIFLYLGADGRIYAHSGTKEVTDQCDQERLHDVYSQALAVAALAGSIEGIGLQEIY
jgi:hypothetical protein